MDKYNHGGIEKATYDFSINLNPLGFMKSIKDIVVSSSLDDTFYFNYPHSYPIEVRESLSKVNSIDSSKIALGVGASELIDRLIRVIKPKKGLVISPCFSEYERCLLNQNCDVIYHDLSSDNDFTLDLSIRFEIERLNKGDMFFLCTPNNPNGRLVDVETIIECIELCKQRQIFLVIDVSFLDFAQSYGFEILDKSLNENKNSYFDDKLNKIIVYSKYVFILNTFTKIFSIPSIRIGYGFSNNFDLINNLDENYIPWSISSLAQRVSQSICNDDSYFKWIDDTKKAVFELRNYLIKELKKYPIRVFKSDCNFILFQDENNRNLKEKLLEYDISIRSCSNYRCLDSSFYRIAVKDEISNQYLIKVLDKIYGVDCG